MPQPKLKESEIFATPVEDWTPEFLLLLKDTMRKRITTLRQARKLASVAESQPEPAKKSTRKKKSLAEEVGLDDVPDQKTKTTNRKTSAKTKA